jgi:hypothetical protein
VIAAARVSATVVIILIADSYETIAGEVSVLRILPARIPAG